MYRPLWSPGSSLNELQMPLFKWKSREPITQLWWKISYVKVVLNGRKNMVLHHGRLHFAIHVNYFELFLSQISVFRVLLFNNRFGELPRSNQRSELSVIWPLIWVSNCSYEPNLFMKALLTIVHIFWKATSTKIQNLPIQLASETIITYSRG